MSEDTFQAVPTLVIGLGGTGLKVATYIKKSLLEANQNQLPRRMAFLVLDTEQDIKFQAGGWGQERGDNHATGPVKIAYGEYIGLTGNVKDLGEKIKEEQIKAEANPSIRRGQPNRHISTWFSAKHYIDDANIKAAVWNLDVGAGRYRQFGRLGLFNRIQTVMTMLKTTMQAIHDMGGNRLYVHIVGSLAGGTGAALFIDVAHMVKQIAPDLNFTQAPVIFGHFVLSEGFRGTPQVNLSQPGIKADFEARCYAALRELTRLQGPVAKTKGYPIVYDPKGSGAMRGTLKDSLYSAVYLYDGVRNNGALNTTTIENGLAPAIADAVVSYIDDLSGGAFCSHSVNYESFYSAHNIPEGEVTYGSIGTYTIELPIYHITEGWSHQLARQLLDTLLEPLDRDKTTGVPTRLVDDQPGSKKVDPKLEARKWTKEEATSMIARLADWGEQAGRGDRLRREAIDAVLATEASVWQHQLAPSDPRFQDYVSEAVSELEGSLTNKKDHKYYVEHNASGNSAAQKASNLQLDVDSKLQLMVGKPDGWRREGGEFRRALVRLGNHHVQEFEKSLINWLHTHLNGSQVGSQTERKGGKLGFVITFLAQLAQNLESSVSVLREAETVSQTKRRPLYNAIEDQRKGLDKTMRRSSGLFAGNLKAYRDKSDELAQFHKADIARQVAHDLVIRVHKSVTQLLVELLLWEQALAKANSAQGGTYALVVEGQTEIDSDRAKSKNQVRWVIDDNEPGDTYIADKHKKYAENKLEDILAQIEWKVGRLDGSGDLRVDFTLNGQLWSRRAGQPGEQKAGLKNSNQLLEACREVFTPAWSDMSVVAYLTENFSTHGNNIEALAKKVHENGDYLLSRTNRDSDPPMRSTFVRVRQEGLAPNDYTFLRQLRQEVATKFKETSAAEEQAKKDKTWSDTGQNSRDPFKLTFVLFGDLLEMEKIAGFISAQQEYRGATGSGAKWRELHILPAETNALSIEKDIDSGNDKVRQKRREFDEEVVAVLEDMERFQLVMRCLAYGETDYAWGGAATGLLLHKYTPPTNNPAGYSYWRLTAAPENRPDSGIRADILPEHYQLTDMSNNPELLQAFIQLVVVGKDRQNGKEISWQRIEKTVQDATERHLGVWREQMEIGWKAKEVRFRQEGEEKATQTIRLNALLAEADAFLARQRWAWSPGNELAPEEIRNDKDKLRRMQREVDLYTAIRGSVTQEINNLGQRLGQLGTWTKNTPNIKVILSPDLLEGAVIAQPDLEMGWTCPNCEQYNDEDNRFCFNCRTRRPEPDDEIQPELTISTEESIPAILALVCEDGHEMQPNWKLCPICGKGLKQVRQELICVNGHAMQPGWILCPICGQGPKQATTKIVCEDGHEMQSGWKLCPICGKGPK